MNIAIEPVLQAATAARERAHAPHSGFRVGAALLSEDGRIFAGCNIEAANFSLTVCAERVALLKAVSEGIRSFRLVCVVADTEEPTPPCGSCRQLLWEFCGDIPLVAATLRGRQETWRLSELLPHPFGAASFQT